MSKRPASVRHLFMVAIDALASQSFVVQFSRHLTKLLAAVRSKVSCDRNRHRRAISRINSDSKLIGG